MKKIAEMIPFRLAAALFAFLFVFAVPAFAEPTSGSDEGEAEDIYAIPETEMAPYVYLYNMENDRVIHSTGNLNEQISTCSTVKIMSGIVAIEALGGDLSRTFTLSSEVLMEAEEESGNRIGLYEGEIVTAEQMLYGMLANSANDAAIVLAHMAAGGVDEFVELMNKKAVEIGAKATYYTDPTGMDPSSVTTVADLSLIARYAYENELFMEIVGTPKYVMEATNKSDYRNIYNRNCLMSKHYRGDYYYEGALGMNAGSTPQGGYCSVTCARSADGSLTYLCIIMGAEPVEVEGKTERELTNYSYAIELYDWAMRTYGYRKVLSAGSVVCELPVGLSSTADYVTLVPADEISVYMPMYADIEKEVSVVYTTEDEVTAPVKKGQKLGIARVIYNGSEIGTSDLCATAEVARSEFLFALERIRNFASSRFFIAAAVSAVVLSVCYVLFTARARQKRLRSRVPRQYRR
ncbi:MAG: D-alanyl-D-alanine carboxypeptidase [Clostridia bacterium]|nr:D-alanyl-D-alanine carboxypeptidase [Clostridia bacterium]